MNTLFLAFTAAMLIGVCSFTTRLPYPDSGTGSFLPKSIEQLAACSIDFDHQIVSAEAFLIVQYEYPYSYSYLA